ncbi:MAG: hypothetical protein R3A10_05365 [Caldilineaceae bacterium]
MSRRVGSRPWAPGERSKRPSKPGSRASLTVWRTTGHGLNIAAFHKRSLEQLQLRLGAAAPYNYRADERIVADEELVAMAQERNVAVQTIKSITRAVVRRIAGRPPGTNRSRIKRTSTAPCIGSSGRPGIFLNTIGDIYVLPGMLELQPAASSVASDEEMRGMVKEDDDLFA